MNALQQMLVTANTQSRQVNQEAVEIDGKILFGTFGDPVPMPIMTRQGYKDHLVLPLKVSRDQFAADPVARCTVKRPATDKTYISQIIDMTNPVVYSFVLVDREL